MNHMVIGKVLFVNEVEVVMNEVVVVTTEVAVVTNVDEVDVAHMIEVVVEDVAISIEVDIVDAAVVVNPRCPSVLPTMLIHIKENTLSVVRVCSNVECMDQFI